MPIPNGGACGCQCDELSMNCRTKLHACCERRPTAEQFLGCTYFASGPVDTMRKLETLQGNTFAQQAEFLRHLPARLDPFPAALLRDFVLPPLRALHVNKVHR